VDEDSQEDESESIEIDLRSYPAVKSNAYGKTQ